MIVNEFIGTAIPYRKQLIGLLDLHIRMEVDPRDPEGIRHISDRIKYEFFQEVVKYILVKELTHTEIPTLEGVLNLPLIMNNHVKTLHSRIDYLENRVRDLRKIGESQNRMINHFYDLAHMSCFKKLWLLFTDPVEYEKMRRFR